MLVGQVPRLKRFTFCSSYTPVRSGMYMLSLHDALPISSASRQMPSGTPSPRSAHTRRFDRLPNRRVWADLRSEEHTSELQSRLHLVCRLLLEKKNKIS